VLLLYLYQRFMSSKNKRKVVIFILEYILTPLLYLNRLVLTKIKDYLMLHINDEVHEEQCKEDIHEQDSNTRDKEQDQDEQEEQGEDEQRDDEQGDDEQGDDDQEEQEQEEDEQRDDEQRDDEQRDDEQRDDEQGDDEQGGDYEQEGEDDKRVAGLKSCYLFCFLMYNNSWSQLIIKMFCISVHQEILIWRCTPRDTSIS
jgi:DNA mismatch repair ATPase MutL